MLRWNKTESKNTADSILASTSGCVFLFRFTFHIKGCSSFVLIADIEIKMIVWSELVTIAKLNSVKSNGFYKEAR